MATRPEDTLHQWHDYLAGDGGAAGFPTLRVRGQIVPPGRVYFVSSIQKISGRRLARMNAQVFCEGAMKMEMVVMGAML